MPPKPQRASAGAEEFQPSARALVSASAAVAAVYVYFLIFAQFGFLQALVAAGRPVTMLSPILAVMGASGMGGSALVAWGYTGARGRTWLGGSFVVAGIAAALAMKANTTGMFLAVAMLTGVGVAGATVSLAALIGRVIGRRYLGITLGAGTGLAYGFCNLPAVFQAGPAWQALIAQGAAAAGLLAVSGLEPRAASFAASATGADYRVRGLIVWVVVFLALVWLDSAAFYVIQHNPDLQGGTWRAPAQLYANAGLHLVTALLAGWALDRGRAGSVILVAMGLLASACWLLGASSASPGLVAALYVTGVSLYSTALVFYPARSGRAGVAALVYAVAGWAGSAIGIGLVEHSRAVPGWFPLVAGLLVGAAMIFRSRTKSETSSA